MIRAREFGTTPDGTRVQAWDLTGEIDATVLTYGARLASLVVRVGGRRRHVVLGFTALEDYLADRSHQGAIAGRYANRIAGAAFDLDGTRYALSANRGANTLHGGADGFARRHWRAEVDGDVLVMHLHSQAGDQGFPGGLDVKVCYSVPGNALRIDYHATTDAPTLLNLTNHAYFNLGTDGGSILGHVVRIAADRYVPVDADMLPTGGTATLDATPLDFRTPAAIGARIDDDHPQLRLAGGYDHTYVLGDGPAVTPLLAASVQAAGLTMEVLTTQPGVQFYTGNNLRGEPFARRSALCLETQHFPDSPHHPDFPTTVLRPGEVFSSTTLYRFTTP